MAASGAPTITVPSPPSTAAAAAQALATMAALSGILTDYNQGSNIRTIAEAFGANIEEQGIWAQALAFQALTYSAMSLFGVTPGVPVAASGIVTFSTSQVSGSAPPATQDVPIPAGTLVQTNGGVQFATTAAGFLGSGLGFTTVPVAAVVPGAAGNVGVNAVIQIITGLQYPLFVSNANPTTGGADAPSVSDSLAAFTAAVDAIGLSTPVAIANAAIGVSFGSEVVKFSTLYEPWIAAGSGAGSGQALWQLFIDNGAGAASSGLVAAVDAKMRGGTTTSGASNASGATGYRDAGVPYQILPVTGTGATVAISGSLIAGVNSAIVGPLVQAAIQTAVSGYFTLPFGTPAQQANIAAAVANAALGNLSALTVSLYYTSAVGTPVSAVTTSPSGRVVLSSMSVTVS